MTPELIRALRSLDGAGVPSPLGPHVAKELLLGELYRRTVIAEVVGTDIGGGGTGAALAVQLTDHLGNAIDRERQVLLRFMATQYDPDAPNTTVTIASAAGEPGSVIASGQGWALVETDAVGLFEGTLTNAADETVYVSASTPSSGVSDTARGCVVLASDSDGITWSA